MLHTNGQHVCRCMFMYVDMSEKLLREQSMLGLKECFWLEPPCVCVCVATEVVPGQGIVLLAISQRQSVKHVQIKAEFALQQFVIAFDVAVSPLLLEPTV